MRPAGAACGHRPWYSVLSVGRYLAALQQADGLQLLLRMLYEPPYSLQIVAQFYNNDWVSHTDYSFAPHERRRDRRFVLAWLLHCSTQRVWQNMRIPYTTRRARCDMHPCEPRRTAQTPFSLALFGHTGLLQRLPLYAAQRLHTAADRLELLTGRTPAWNFSLQAIALGWR
jgi:hypothetical protein